MESILVKRVQHADDHQAFERLMQQNQGPVRQFLRRLTQQDHAVADELAQETFFKAYRHIGSYRNEGRFLSWLFKIAYQHFIESKRKKRITGDGEYDDIADEQDFESRIVAERTVQQLVKYLREDERAAILLHFQHELSQQEVSTVMELPLGTVKSLIRRGKLKLQQLIQNAQQKNQDDGGENNGQA